MNRRIHSFLLTLAVAVLAGCHQNVTADGGDSPAPNFAFEAVAPASVKANFGGVVELQGTGFSEFATVNINGIPANQMPGLTVQFVSPTAIHLQLQGMDDAGSGVAQEAGNWNVEIVQGGARLAQPLFVKPFLQRLEYLRTIPEFFLNTGGTLEMWLQPVDSEEIVMLPGHIVAGDEGLGLPNFTWEGVTLTHEGGTVATPSADPIVRVFVDRRFAGDGIGFAVAIDHSGSMGGNDGNGIRFEATKQFVDSLSPGSEMMTIEFDNTPVIRLPFTTDKVALKSDLDAFANTGEGGGTAIYDALMVALDELATLNSTQAKVAIALTDGQDSDSSATPQEVVDRADQIGATIFTIGLGANNVDSNELIFMARETGGTYFEAADADALVDIFQQFGNFQADSYRVEANLTFDPPLQDAGKYTASVKVTCNADDEFKSTDISNATIYVGGN